MDHLPHDPAMLVSSVNMLLRDEEFESLDEVCNYYDEDTQKIVDLLADYGYVWCEEQKQLRPKGFDGK